MQHPPDVSPGWRWSCSGSSRVGCVGYGDPLQNARRGSCLSATGLSRPYKKIDLAPPPTQHRSSSSSSSSRTASLSSRSRSLRAVSVGHLGGHVMGPQYWGLGRRRAHEYVVKEASTRRQVLDRKPAGDGHAAEPMRPPIWADSTDDQRSGLRALGARWASRTAADGTAAWVPGPGDVLALYQSLPCGGRHEGLWLYCSPYHWNECSSRAAVWVHV